ncbi:MAG TPA: hypothetical protein VL175_12830 [Pirellulales bacterium]|jgi:hypothetical protein|nr:hypothetical protein [Pirellulales bacterium]
MPNVTIGFGAVLCAIGLFGYFGSASDTPSPTALIPLGFGVVLIICGLIARSPGARRHAMHAAAAVSLVGCIAAAARGVPKLGMLVSDIPVSEKRPVRLIMLMAIVCLAYVIVCVGSFVAARRRRATTPAAP